VTETLSPALPADVEALVRRVLKQTSALGLKLSTAESCTGGLIASILTDIDGLGSVFDRGFVVYTDAAKHELLGVPRDLLADAGAVSKPVACAMADGALRRSGADLAIAVSGFTGPGGPGDEPGLVHFALARPARPTAHRVERFGAVDRGEGRVKTLRVALQMLNDALEADV
jgi:nicotinamide-nucleotide amidase